jgi:hypothetical protein
VSRDHNPPVRDVTADEEHTVSSVVACWTVFAELLPNNALIKSVTIFFFKFFAKAFWLNILNI